MKVVKTRLSPENTHKNRVKNAKFFCLLLDTEASGSPIIQGGKLIGAVTYVLVVDTACGYGIFIEEEEKQKIAEVVF